MVKIMSNVRNVGKELEIDGVVLTLCVVCPFFESITGQSLKEDPTGVCQYSRKLNGKRWCLM